MPETMNGGEQITFLLQRIHKGDRSAESELVPAVYEHLHRLAEWQFRSERPGHTLQPTALLSELYLRIIRDTSIDWKSRTHFYRVAAQTMRRILVDHARAAKACRRPSSSKRVQFDEVVVYSQDCTEDILMIDEALTKLRDWDERQANVIELRFFGGFSVEETAAALGVSERTVKRDWLLARAWLSTVIRSAENSSAH